MSRRRTGTTARSGLHERSPRIRKKRACSSASLFESFLKDGNATRSSTKDRGIRTSQLQIATEVLKRCTAFLPLLPANLSSFC